MRTLGEELINESRDGHVRVAAGIALKNSLVAKDYERRRSLEEKWIALDAASKFQIKHLVSLLHTGRSSAAMSVFAE